MKTINKKLWKLVKHEFCANQMWYVKTNIDVLNYSVWHGEKKRINLIILYVWPRVNHELKHFKLHFCIIIDNEPTDEHCFNDIASNYTKVVLKLYFAAMFCWLLFSWCRERDFSDGQYHYNLRVLRTSSKILKTGQDTFWHH